MKKIKLIVFALIVFISFSGCEKDDICDKPTTPRLIIEFYDVLHPTVLKDVTNLKVTGEGMTDFLSFTGVSKIQLPLKTTEDLTKYSLILNSTDTTVANEDKLQFNYTHYDVFVSRACGYKTLFTLDPTTPVVHSDSATADGFWMQNMTIETSNIETENETHIKIYF